MSTQAAAPRSRLDPEPASRRDFLGLTSLATTMMALGFGIVGLLRLPKAAVLSSPSKKFSVNLPESWPAGAAYIPTGRSVALFRDPDGVYAISLICTHLGCIVKTNQDGFECPCHGSRFYSDGKVSKGPAPQPLPWYKVSLQAGRFMVDQGEIVAPGTKLKV